MEFCIGRYARIAAAMGLAPCGAAAAVAAVKRLAEAVRLPSFSSLNIPPSDYQRICAASAKNISTQSNPRPMSERDYMNVLEAAGGI